MRKRLFDWLTNLGVEKAAEEAAKENIDVQVEFCTCCEIRSLFHDRKCVRCDSVHVGADVWIGVTGVVPKKLRKMRQKTDAVDIVLETLDQAPSEVKVELYREDMQW